MRRLFIILGGILAVAVIALALLPWWLRPVLKGVAHKYGADFARYERVGYTRFALHDVVVIQPTVRVQMDRVETETPLLWLFHRWTKRPAEIAGTRWQVEVKSREGASKTPPSPDAGAMHTRAILFKVAEGLERWIPRAKIGEGVVKWPGGGLEAGSAQWQERSLAVSPLRLGTQAGDVRATFTKNNEIKLEVRPIDQAPWEVSLTNMRDEITGELRAWEQRAPISARLPERGWMPVSAELRAEQWAIPAARLKLGDLYTTVRGNAQLEWREGKFEAAVDATGEAQAGKKAPPLAAKLHARGDSESLAVDALSLEMPGALAKLSDPVVFDRKTRRQNTASHFTLDVDLAKQPWLAGAKGRATGRVELTPRSDGFPLVDATFDASDLSVSDWSVARFAAATTFDWPRLQVKEARLGFTEGGEFTLHGGWDFQSKELVDLVADGTLRPSLIARWLPAKVGFESVALALKAHGPIATLEHEGRAHVKGFTAATVNPLEIELAWQGQGSAVEVSEVRAEAGASRLVGAGSLDATGVRITALTFTKGNEERLTLREPATVRWSPKIEIGPLQLSGANASLAFTAAAGDSGRVNLSVRNFPSDWLADFMALPGPEWALTSLDVAGDWNAGPLAFSIKSELTATLAPERFAQVALAAAGDRDGIKIDSLRVSEGASPIVNATGTLPLAFYPAAASKLEIRPDAPLALHATTADNPAFWKKLFEATGLEFQEPEVEIELSGTWARPQGAVSAKATRVAADPERIKFIFPTVESLDAHATADSQGLTLDRFSVQVQGQAVRGSGHLPLTLAQWPDFRRAPVAFLRRSGNFRLEVPDAEVGAFARYLPTYLAPSGRVHIDVTLQPGGEMSGAFRLQNAATRPLGPLGVLQEIEAEAQFAGRSVEIKSVTARTGGQPVTLSGKIQLPLEGAPKYDLALKGENLPLVRETGVLIRADLDLKLVTRNDDVPAVLGTVKLRDSVFLSDVRALIPKGGGGGPARRPPFFAIENPPLNAWRLGIDVRGDNFLRLRSTVFAGVASARFRLGGTLGDPRAVGEVVVESGLVLLPFATFRVEQGTVRLTEADPYSLQLFLVGASRRYGFDLRMELTGTAADPIVTFSSSPPLEAKQVLLMVTAGEVPRDEFNYTGAQRMARLGTYLGQSLINNFGGDAADADRLSISTGERVSRQGRETYNIEYNFTDRLAFVGEYDEFDDYNAGLKWSLTTPQKSISRTRPGTNASSAAKKKQEAADAGAR